MSRRGIDRLPKPPKKYQIQPGVLEDGTWFAFETKDEAKEEDKERCKRASRLISKKRKIDHQWRRSEIAALIDRIDSASTVASSVYMRKHRKRVGGHLLRLMSRDITAVRMFTLLPANWIYPAGSLCEADAVKLLTALRQALRRKGANRASGWLFAFIDGEYDSASDTFRLHVHGLASGEMIDVVKRMKGTRNLQPFSKSKREGAVRRPVLSQKITTTPIRAATYVMKSHWGERPFFQGEGLTPKRPRGKRRIDHIQPFVEHLLWLDQWRLQDLALLIGMSVSRAGFKIHRKCT
ncbi:MAG: hypothetical protein JHD35_08180 [Sphingopyxis sp.]|nr:hypothetical protein [Sphingopyxis sp.]